MIFKFKLYTFFSPCVSCFNDPSGGAIILPDPPEKPLNSDCCGNGCTPCVLDIYEEDLHIWELECQAIREGRQNNSTDPRGEHDTQVLEIKSIINYAFQFRLKK